MRVNSQPLLRPKSSAGLPTSVGATASRGIRRWDSSPQEDERDGTVDLNRPPYLAVLCSTLARERF